MGEILTSIDRFSKSEYRDPVTDDLKDSLNEAEWSWLKPHAERDAVVVVAAQLDLLTVGRAIAADELTRVGEWLRGGLLAKPTSEQKAAWENAPTLKFRTLIVQPYVLVQLGNPAVVSSNR